MPRWPARSGYQRRWLARPAGQIGPPPPVEAKPDRKTAVIDLVKCTLCGACVEACKRYKAIVITRRTFKAQKVELYKGICVYAEHRKFVLQ